MDNLKKVGLTALGTVLLAGQAQAAAVRGLFKERGGAAASAGPRAAACGG